jgi:DNA-binding NarL/FixJ family response regulator
MNINVSRSIGKKCLGSIKSNKTLKDIPVIVLSSNTDHPDNEDYDCAGASIYLVKANSFDALVKTLRLLGINSTE